VPRKFHRKKKGCADSCGATAIGNGKKKKKIKKGKGEKTNRLKGNPSCMRREPAGKKYRKNGVRDKGRKARTFRQSSEGSKSKIFQKRVKEERSGGGAKGNRELGRARKLKTRLSDVRRNPGKTDGRFKGLAKKKGNSNTDNLARGSTKKKR